jgi:hypothetical protein
MQSPIGQRGKATEKVVEALLKELNERHLEFAWHRYPDARAAMGRLKAQPCDYLIAAFGKAYHLEVKETRHAYLLPKAKVGQVPTLLKFAGAGIDFAVLVHHEGLGWRIIPSWYFAQVIPPSWNLSPFPLYDNAGAALKATGWFSDPGS